MLQPRFFLRLIKVIHTLVWGLFAAAILAIPVFALFEQWPVVAALVGLVLIECLILVVNNMRCPLTSLAARYSTEDRDNFDIYLPLWLAKNNKLIFGPIFVAGVLFALLRLVMD